MTVICCCSEIMIRFNKQGFHSQRINKHDEPNTKFLTLRETSDYFSIEYIHDTNMVTKLLMFNKNDVLELWIEGVIK